MSVLRMLPPVHKLLAEPSISSLFGSLGHQVVADGVRHVVETLRKELLDGTRVSISPEEAAGMVVAHLTQKERPQIRSVINATGIILHTNLGRSPLAPTAAPNRAWTMRSW